MYFHNFRKFDEITKSNFINLYSHEMYMYMYIQCTCTVHIYTQCHAYYVQYSMV